MRDLAKRLDCCFGCAILQEDWMVALVARSSKKTGLSLWLRNPAKGLDCRFGSAIQQEDWIVALVARSSKKTGLSLPAQSSNKCYTNDHSMLNNKPCRHGLLLSTRHVTRPTAELLLGFDNCPKQRKSTFYVNLTRRLDRFPQKTSIFRFQYRVSLRNSPQCTAARRQRSEQPRCGSKAD